MRLITYTRVSTDEQATDGVSLAIQPQQMANYALVHGHSIVREIADQGVSGSVPLPKRRGGAELCAAIAAGEADGVLVVRLDRLFRDVYDGLQFFAQGGVNGSAPQVLSASEMLDTSTPMGRFMLNMLLSTAQYERDLAAQRASDNTRAMREQGRVFGTVPYGCVEIGRSVDNDGVVHRGRLVREPEAWGHREQIVAWRVEGSTYDAIRQTLHLRKVPAPTGGRRWGKSTLRGIVETHASLLHLPMQGEGACP